MTLLQVDATWGRAVFYWRGYFDQAGVDVVAW
jgi:hypothetical protein